MTTPEHIRAALALRPPQLADDSRRRRAAVAMILRQAENGLESLFIRRSEHHADPWSGNLAFPGGKVDPGDAGPLGAALRETREEIGIDLEGSEYLGRLSDIHGATLPVTISCFVFLLAETAAPHAPAPNEEVREAFWFPLEELANEERHGTASVDWHGARRSVPGIDLLGSRGPALWGITYRLVMQFLECIEAAPGD